MRFLYSVIMTVILLFIYITLAVADAPLVSPDPVGFQRIAVADKDELKNALRQVLPGTTIVIAPGLYARGIYLKDVHGTAEAPIIITGADPNNPPVFEGSGEGAKLSNCSYVKLGSMVFQGFSGNGINIDDGGDVQSPSHHIVFEKLVIQLIGSKGNQDALKMSGVNHFVVRNSRFEGWGGSGIDLVGCHYGIIEGCRFLGKEGYRTANGVQIKGGSRFILVQTSLFRNAGERAINLGGSTGLSYFRPSVEGYEAKDIIIAGNYFIGGEAHIAWVTSEDTHVHRNLFLYPEKWVCRILQETKDSQFAPCRRGLFENNLVVLGDRVKSIINTGRGTRPETFVFRGNTWYRHDGSSKPSLPTAEQDGLYGVDPKVVDSGEGLPSLGSTDDRLRSIGPWRYKPYTLSGEFADVLLSSVRVPVAIERHRDRKGMLLAVAGMSAVGFVGYRSLYLLLIRGKRRKRRYRR